MNTVDLPLHFILCLERTGSTMFATMLNSSEHVVAPVEDPFLLYFSSKYGKKTSWSRDDFSLFVEEFFLLQDVNLSAYFISKEEIKNQLYKLPENSNFLTVCKAIYLGFYKSKDKSKIEVIIDKQIKFSYHLKEIKPLLPESKFCILIRDPVDTLASWRKRGMGKFSNALYLAEFWKLTYKKLWEFNEKYPTETMVVRYEELATNPEKELKKVCEFFNIQFSSSMLNFNENFNSFTKEAKNTSPKFIDYIESFHSGLQEPANIKNIGIGEHYFTKDEQQIIRTHCREIANQYGYNVKAASRTMTIWKPIIVFAARFKIYKLRFYRNLPFSLKKLIRKINPRVWPS
ncbi:MAG: hypothetical protein ACI9J3_000124 [Parvicellaceae bacterium]|jgi:hypothetical protein